MRPDQAHLRSLMEGASIEAEIRDDRVGVMLAVDAVDVRTVLVTLADDGYEMLVDLFAVDTGDSLEVTYHLRSFAGDTEVYVRVGSPYDGEIPSVWESHLAAFYAEREAAELFGLTFLGHPNPKRLLTSDRVDTYLMRKDVPVRTHEEVRRDG